jgi:putative sterol carrier protein
VLAYLSDEWVTAVDEALSGLDPTTFDPPVSLTIHQTVTGGPNGDCSYSVWFDGGRAGAGRRAPGGTTPDVSLTCDWDTAVGIATGKDRAQRAFLDGRLRLGGDSRPLVAHAGVLATIDDVLAGVRADTDYTGYTG